jgi:adenylate cyclase
MNEPATPWSPRFAQLAEWLVRDAGRYGDGRELVAAAAERLIAAGVPLMRLAIHVRTLHPEIQSYLLLWEREAGASLTPRYHGVELEPDFTNSPVYWIHGGAERFRRRLEDPEVAVDFAVLRELKAAGATDYVAVGLSFTDGSNNALTWATDRPGGFSDADLALLEALRPYFALTAEVRSIRRTTERLLEVYLGPDAGRRVLRGEVRRGVGETIAAAVFFADMRDFTLQAAALPGDAVIALLDDYFECVIPPVEAEGGQVLKLIGDGLLAIVPLQGGVRAACRAAFAAAVTALGNLAELNRRRAAQAQPPVRVGITLHLGAVIYGNIGSAHRLDFTVIGQAVNLVSRLQPLCRRLHRSVLFSAEFAEASGLEAASLGHFELRGIAEPQEVFGPPEVGDLASERPESWSG